MTHSIITLAFFLLTLFCAVAIRCRDIRIRGLEHHCDELERISREAIDQRNEAHQLIAIKDIQIGRHIRDWELLMSEYWQLERGDNDAANVVREAEAILLEAVL